MNPEDFQVTRGDSYRMVGWAFPFNVAGHAVELRVAWEGGTIVKTHADPGIEAVEETINTVPAWVIYWTPTVQESASIPEGNLSEYSLVLSFGDRRRTYKTGNVIGLSP